MADRLERKSVRARRFVSNPPFPGSCSRRKLVYRALSNMEESLFRVDDFRCVLGALSSRDVCTRRGKQARTESGDEGSSRYAKLNRKAMEAKGSLSSSKQNIQTNRDETRARREY